MVQIIRISHSDIKYRHSLFELFESFADTNCFRRVDVMLQSYEKSGAVQNKIGFFCPKCLYRSTKFVNFVQDNPIKH